MSDQNSSSQFPSGPPCGMPEFMLTKGPPPSYEESQKLENRFPPSYGASVGSSGSAYSSIYPVSTAGYSVQGQQYAQAPTHSSFTLPSSGAGTPSKVIEFDAGARFGKGAGALRVPPPPPGYQPTAAQLAALQGQAVILKQKRNSFF